MSPEQVRGDVLDARTDIFSFGAVLYEMATGQHAFAGATSGVIFHAILAESSRPVAELNSAVPPELAAIINHALEKNREARYSSAARLRDDLAKLQRTLDSGVVPSSATGPVSRISRRPVAESTETAGFARRRRWTIAAGASVAAIVIIALAGVYLHFHRARKLTEKDTIVLADFANNTGDAVFDDTLKTALNISLRQSPFLNVFSDSDVAKTLKLMSRPADTKLTAEVAGEICQRAGSKAYIAGSIAGLGSEYVLGLKAVNCRSGDTLAEEQATAASKEKVLNALGHAASRLRSALGESLATVQKFDVPLEQVTTSSLEALQAYSLGLKMEREKGATAAMPYYQGAIELDPNFAVGYLGVASLYYNLEQEERAKGYFTKAFQLRERTSEREKLTISALYYRIVTGERDKAAQTFQQEIDNYPRHYQSYFNLGLVYGDLGNYEQALEAARQGLHLASNDPTGYVSLAGYTLALQRLDEARQIIHDAQARKIDNVYLHQLLYPLAFLAGDSAGMVEQQQWFAGQQQYEDWGLALAADTAAYGGHVGQARQLTQRAADSANRTDNKERGAIWQAISAQRDAAYGYPAEARQSATDALKLVPTSQGVESEAALAFAMAGDAAQAESLAEDLGKHFPLDTQMQGIWLPAIRGQVALDQKDPASALNALRAGSAIELGQIQFALNTSCLYSVYVRGEAYLAAGQGSAAAAEFQKIIDHSGIVWNCWTGSLAHLGVARANALQAKTS
jgi:tetratricopeptide (TPR) repeat protein